ncbi:MAG TPA: hypothetical protein VFU04_05890 [Solirubrobacterales bacterium]|nr:hypothetical protein [Solirubrobacterales bacterium]
MPLLIPARFNGPTESGNGGYASGAIAAYVGGSAAVSLRSPVPLDRPLEVKAEEGSARTLDGETLVAEAEAAPDFQLDVPSPVGIEEAREAGSRYRGVHGGQFSRCFVCGLDRDDGLRLFAGEVPGRDLVAAPWTPPEWVADDAAQVRPEVVWGALDCPTYFAAYLREDLAVSFLGRMTARIDSPVRAGIEHVVIAWPISAEGRKRLAGSAVLDADGKALAVAEVLLIEPRA